MGTDVALVLALIVLGAAIVIALLAVLVSRCARRGPERPAGCPLAHGHGWARPAAPPERRGPRVNRYGELED